MRIPPLPQPKPEAVLHLAIPERCKAELTYVTLKCEVISCLSSQTHCEFMNCYATLCAELMANKFDLIWFWKLTGWDWNWTRNLLIANTAPTRNTKRDFVRVHKRIEWMQHKNVAACSFIEHTSTWLLMRKWITRILFVTLVGRIVMSRVNADINFVCR